jgi:hypothetical protein
MAVFRKITGLIAHPVFSRLISSLGLYVPFKLLAARMYVTVGTENQMQPSYMELRRDLVNVCSYRE